MFYTYHSTVGLRYITYIHTYIHTYIYVTYCWSIEIRKVKDFAATKIILRGEGKNFRYDKLEGPRCNLLHLRVRSNI